MAHGIAARLAEKAGPWQPRRWVLRPYFLVAGLALSCFGFRFFLSFFCELLPLPMIEAPSGGGDGWLRSRPTNPFIGNFGTAVEWDRFSPTSVR